jgi:hypothetical protein
MSFHRLKKRRGPPKRCQVAPPSLAIKAILEKQRRRCTWASPCAASWRLKEVQAVSQFGAMRKADGAAFWTRC